MTHEEKSLPVVWSIAGSDSSAGAGMQADIKTLNRLGVQGRAVLTAVTAQNAGHVHGVYPVGPDVVDQQVRSLLEDHPPAAVKIGMLGTRDILSCIAGHLARVQPFVVCDPVLTATSGGDLLEPDSLSHLKQELLPCVDVLTPNVPEAERLLGRKLSSESDLEEAASDLLRLGPRSVLIKGGHVEGPYSQDVWTNGTTTFWLTADRCTVPPVHGTGCVLSSALAACKALGYDLASALVIAKAYVRQGIRRANASQAGGRHVAPLAWPSHPSDFPWLTRSAAEGRRFLSFPPCDDLPLGLYPIVDRAAWLEKLLPLGQKLIQLRIKNGTPSQLEDEIRAAVECARRHQARLYVNDHWELAIRHGAYGVHLGQDDLQPDALQAIAASGLRLGISTHSYAELARAWSLRPSYLALGTLFETTSKVMDYSPLGLSELRRMCSLMSVPVVAIGGIHLQQARDVWQAGAEGMAVISEITESPRLRETVDAWHAFFRAPPERAPAWPDSIS